MSDDPKIELALSAKAKAEVSLRAEIPADAMGRLVDSLTDIIRPFSEKRGLRADQIRLQRVETLLTIVKVSAHLPRVWIRLERARTGPVGPV